MGVALEAKIDSNKLRGGYYTPKPIADFICRWAIRNTEERVLEPSCGDGNFIEAAIERFLDLGLNQENLHGHIQAVELIEEEAAKAKERAAVFGLNSTTILNSDFFRFVRDLPEDTTYDVVIGNPPFIRYQNFPEKHRDLAITLMSELGIIPNKLTNIWVPFLVIAANKLSDNGRLGMVIPAELFQVKYAADTRVFLSHFFQRITIVTFKKLVFQGIQQEVVILLCDKQVEDNQGIRVVELNNLEELLELDVARIQEAPIKAIDHTREKWTKYFLDIEEIHLMRVTKDDETIRTCGSYMQVDVGIVTGRNEFFMLKEQQVRERHLEEYVRRVVSKSPQLKGITFNEQDFIDNSNSQNTTYLFLPPNVPADELPHVCQEYITYGESKKHHTGYKCKIRKRWYITPSVSRPDGFALRQVNEFPKLVLNQGDASSTDTIHRVRFNPNVNPQLAVVSFLNSLTFAFSEILGRSYGGGVLTFEPTEVEELPLPMLIREDAVDFNHIDQLMREKRIEEVLNIVDRALLIDQLGYSKEEATRFRNVWRKLSNRRINRKKK
ncbi:class I SAM-dependent methyltransferase [Pontibacter indicus]|uniref:site-specific DNA-methyltransferase (adenine-specific) n=1 Tax=Pontibacter indicus TaxID=1317125 RepID=A0A1R3XS35_9BACT|nr:class I SAM-dependent methyltransferase [Pontibacter indicus]SIT94670.1 adenine-specific DNA-methyltransferase [Pontibacter indicus]